MPLTPDHNASPFNDLPPVAVFAALAMVVIEIVVELAAAGYIGGPGGVGWRNEMLYQFSFSGPLIQWMLVDTGRWSPDIVWRFVTYPFVHGSFTHMMFAVVILLALGKYIGEVFSGLALTLLWLGSAVVGAVAFMFLTDTQVPLYGGMPPDYGLVGALTWLLWRKARITGEHPATAFRMIGFLIAIQVLLSLMAGGGIGPQIIAELAGFATGFGLSFVLVPGGWDELRRAIRKR